MAKKKRKTNPAISDPKPEASEQIVNSDEVSTAEKNEISESAEDSDASTEPEVSETDVSEEKSAEEDEIIVSEETLAVKLQSVFLTVHISFSNLSCRSLAGYYQKQAYPVNIEIQET